MGLHNIFSFKGYPLRRSSLPKDMGELTLKDLKTAEYQTKDLEISILGEFFLRKNRGEYVIIHRKREYKQFKSTLVEIGVTEEVVNDPPHYLEVYTFFQRPKSDYWVKLRIIFQGKAVEGVTCLEFEVRDNTNRKAVEEKLKEEYQQYQAYQKTLWGKVHVFLSRFQRNYLFRLQHNLGHFVSRIGNSISNWRI